MKMRIIDWIKLGIGLYVGHEIAKQTDKALGEVFALVKERIKNGYIM